MLRLPSEFKYLPNRETEIPCLSRHQLHPDPQTLHTNTSSARGLSGASPAFLRIPPPTPGRIDFLISNRAHSSLDTPSSSLLEITFPRSLGRGFWRANLSFSAYQAALNGRYFQRTCSCGRITSLQGLYSSALPSSPSWALHQHISMHSIPFWKAETFPARALRASWSKWLCLLLKICLKYSGSQQNRSPVIPLPVQCIQSGHF